MTPASMQNLSYRILFIVCAGSRVRYQTTMGVESCATDFLPDGLDSLKALMIERLE